MNLNSILNINFKKLTRYKVKSSFLIVPITLLVTLSIIISSQARNLLQAAETSIFGTLDEQGTLIQLQKEQAFNFSSGGASMRSFQIGDLDDTQFSELDLQKILGLDDVASASILSSLPISNAKTADLFENIELAVSNLVGIPSDLAGIYTNEDFTYIEGEPIPIVLNARTFIENYEDWKDRSEITVDFGTPQAGGPRAFSLENSDFPNKTRAIEYDKNDLLGSEFTINFGGLTPQQTFETNPIDNGIQFKKFTAEELAVKEQARKDAISPYWDYERISTPLSYTFKVVGVVESETDFETFVPSDFANKVMRDLVQHQLDSRIGAELTADTLSEKFSGMQFDGTELTAGAGFGFGTISLGRPVGGSSGGAFITNASSDSAEQIQYEIPGLILAVERESDEDSSAFNPFAQSTVTGLYTATDAYDLSVKKGMKLLVKVADITERGSVVKALNDAGYAYQDLSKAQVFEELQSTLNTVVLLFTLAYGGLAVVVIVFTMGKFVSESKREIGIFRALGVTRSGIRNLFIGQAFIYTFIAYLAGTLLGLGLTLLVAPAINSWFSSFISRTLGEAYNTVEMVPVSVFTRIDWQAVLLYSAALLVITLVVSLIPALRASNVSPVKAIRGE